MVVGEGFEPSKAEPSDLQSDPFDRSGTPPTRGCTFSSAPPHLSTQSGEDFPKKSNHLRPQAVSGTNKHLPRPAQAARTLCKSARKTKQREPDAIQYNSIRPSGGVWCRQWDSNSRPTDYKSVALPTELYRQGRAFYAVCPLRTRLFLAGHRFAPQGRVTHQLLINSRPQAGL